MTDWNHDLTPEEAFDLVTREAHRARRAEEDLRTQRTYEHGVLAALAQEMRISGNDRVAEYGWRLTRLMEAFDEAAAATDDA